MILVSIIIVLFAVDCADEPVFLSAYEDGAQDFFVLKDAGGAEIGNAFLKVQRKQDQIKLMTRVEKNLPDSSTNTRETAWYFESSGQPIQCSRVDVSRNADGEFVGSSRMDCSFAKDKILIERIWSGGKRIRQQYERPEGVVPLFLDCLGVSPPTFDSWVIFAALAQKLDGSPPIIFLYQVGDRLVQVQHRIVSSRKGTGRVGEFEYPVFEFMIAEQENLARSININPGSIVPRQQPGSHIELDARAASQSWGDVNDYETLKSFRNRRGNLTHSERARVQQIMNRHQANSLRGDIAPTIRVAVFDGRLASFRHVAHGGIFLLEPGGDVDVKIEFNK